MHLAVAQAPVARGDVAANLAAAARLLDAAQAECGGRLDLLALPELFLTGYLLRDDLHRVAESLPQLPPLPAAAAEGARDGVAVDGAAVGGGAGVRGGGGAGAAAGDGPAATAGDAGDASASQATPLPADAFAFGPAAAGLLALAAAHRVHLVAGLVERAGGSLYNVALLVGPDGYVGHYRKRYLPNFGPFEEQIYFGAGGAQTPVFDTPCGRVGLQVCYDLFFPWQSLALARAGAELIVNISASPTTSRPLFHRVLPARAIETTCYWGFANNVGLQGSLTFAGESVIVAPRGEVLARAPAFEEGVAVAELPLADLPALRAFRPLLRDGAGEPLPG